MKILLFSDLHCHNYEQFATRLPSGRNSRLQDCLNIIEQVKELCVSEGIGKVFFLGDLFHSRTKLDVDVHTSTFQAVSRLSEWIGADNLYLLKGNHDEYTKVGEIHSLESFRSLGSVIDKPTIISTLGEGISIACYPHTSDVDGMRNWLNQMPSVDILFFHQGISEAAVGPYDMHVKTELSIKDVPFHKVKLVAAGDYHKRQFMADGKFHYIGSPLQLSMGERDEQKCFSIIDTRTWEVKSVPTNAPKFFQFESPESLQNFIDQGRVNPKKDFIRLVTSEPSSKSVQELRTILPDVQVIANIERVALGRVDAKILGDDRLLLEAYAKSQGIKEDLHTYTDIGFMLLAGDRYES